MSGKKKPETFLMFSLFDQIKGQKTQRWAVHSVRGTWLGTIKWYGSWRKYVFVENNQDCIFDSSCLREITEFLEHETCAKHLNSLVEESHEIA